MYFNALQKHKAVCLLTYGKQTLKFPFNRADKSEFPQVEATIEVLLNMIQVLDLMQVLGNGNITRDTKL